MYWHHVLRIMYSLLKSSPSGNFSRCLSINSDTIGAGSYTTKTFGGTPVALKNESMDELELNARPW